MKSLLALVARLNWIHVVFIATFHVLAVVAVLGTHPRPVDIALLVVLYFATGFGITVGFHRLIAHRGFQVPRWLKNTFAFFGTAGLQGGPVMWSMVHRRHHQLSDKPTDPHSPQESFFFGHCGWILLRKHAPRYENLVKDVLAEPFFRWLDRPLTSIVPALSLGILCYLIGGWQGMLWGTFLRTVLMWNATWCVNSFAHVFGSREFETPDNSRNLWWVGIIALGEGWHNNHHARPRCAFHGIRWWQIDFSKMLIIALEKVGLVRNVIRPRSKDAERDVPEVEAAAAS